MFIFETSFIPLTEIYLSRLIKITKSKLTRASPSGALYARGK